MCKISIITTVYNGAATIGDCLQSVQEQVCEGVEHIVVDGGSTDSTLQVVQTFARENLQIISEPDKGIYDGMNKGIGLASGEIIGILNADDLFADHRVLADVCEVFEQSGADSCYGDLRYVDSADLERTVRLWRSGDFRPAKFLWGWMPPHPTFFVRRTIYERFGRFNLQLGTAADYELMLRFLVKHRVSTAYLPRVLVHMRSGGVSNKTVLNRLKANRMDRRAWAVNGLVPYPWTLLLKPLRKLNQWWRC